MKTIKWLVLVMVMAVVGWSGCGDKKVKVNTAKLESSFASAEATVKAEVQKAVDLIKNQDLLGGVTQLQKTYARASAKLSQEQKDAIKETIETLQKLIAEGANKSVEKTAGQTTKALEDLQKAGKK